MIPKSFPAALVALPLALGAILFCDTDRLNAVGETDQDPQQKSFRKPDVIGAPELTMRISGFLMGRLTPCGCASGQLGGLPRRVFNLKADRNHELLIEGGRIIDGSHGVTELDLEKMSTALQVLSESKYHALGISPKDQPPHHYRLLGIDLFEDDQNVIESAADRQMTHVRTFQAGKYSILSQDLLNEIAGA